MPFIRNYYLVVGVIFIVWIIFFDSNNLIAQYKNRNELNELLRQKKFFETEIVRNRERIKELTNTTDKSALETFAREEYLMKRKNEVVFQIVKNYK